MSFFHDGEMSEISFYSIIRQDNSSSPYINRNYNIWSRRNRHRMVQDRQQSSDFSLEALSMISIVTAAWKAEIVEILCKNPIKEDEIHYKQMENRISLLKLPEVLNKKLKELVYPVGKEFFDFVPLLERLSTSTDVLRGHLLKIEFTGKGEVDEYKVFEGIIKSGSVKMVAADCLLQVLCSREKRMYSSDIDLEEIERFAVSINKSTLLFAIQNLDRVSIYEEAFLTYVEAFNRWEADCVLRKLPDGNMKTLLLDVGERRFTNVFDKLMETGMGLFESYIFHKLYDEMKNYLSQKSCLEFLE